MRGFTAVLETEPDMNEARFAQLASKLLAGKSQIRHLAAAPDLVVRLVYPVDGNERALGLDYTKNPAQRDAALARPRHRRRGAGGAGQPRSGRPRADRAFSGVRLEERRQSHFWGIVSAVIDEQRLLADSGLLSRDLPIRIALTGKDGTGGAGKPFYGPESVLNDNPVTADVTLPTGSWEIAAVPDERLGRRAA